MVMLCRLVGITSILFGIFGSSWGIEFALLPVLGGVLLLGVAEIIQSLRKIESRLINMHLQNAGMKLQTYSIHSNEFIVFRGDTERYQFFEMDEEQYVRVRIFKNYIEYDGKVCKISLPNKECISFEQHDHYSPGVDLWNKHGMAYIRLGALGLRGTLSADGKIIVESLDNLS